MSLNLLKQTQSEKQMYAALRSAEKLEQSENKGRAKLVCFKNGLKTNSKPFENIFDTILGNIYFTIWKQNSTAR